VRNILLDSNRAMLRAFMRRRVLLAFDYDGTLAPIVADPCKAQLPPDTRKLLGAVAQTFPCAVISGRALADIARLVAGVPFTAVVGNHGNEVGGAPGTTIRHWRIDAWSELLREHLLDWPGIVIEDKGHSIAVHYRRAPRQVAASEQIKKAVLRCDGARTIHGKCVFDVLPIESPGKAAALERLSTTLDCEAAIYVGDDTTDEDVFTMADPARTLTVRVGWSDRSRAGYYLRRRGDIDRLLEAVLAAR
jgi:trehalose 6-phosphate phosphatase